MSGEGSAAKGWYYTIPQQQILWYQANWINYAFGITKFYHVSEQPRHPNPLIKMIYVLTLLVWYPFCGRLNKRPPLIGQFTVQVIQHHEKYIDIHGVSHGNIYQDQEATKSDKVKKIITSNKNPMVESSRNLLAMSTISTVNHMVVMHATKNCIMYKACGTSVKTTMPKSE